MKDALSRSACRSACVLVGMLLCCAVVLGQRSSGPTKTTVADVIIQGNKLVPTDRIKGLLRTKPGLPFSEEMVNEDVRKLLETRQFKSSTRVEVKDTGDGQVVVYFLCEEFPNLVREIIYEGAKHLKPDELNTLTGLRKETPLNPLANQMACQQVVRRYQEQGRLFATCELVEGGKPTDTRVVFRISEGQKVKVKGIAFTGNTFVSSARLSTQVNTSKQFLGLFGGDYNPTMVDLDVAKLEEYYKSFGFQDVRVSRELQWRQDLSGVLLVFHIDEGLRYKVQGTVVEGVKAFPAEQIESIPRLTSGQFYSEHKAEADVNTIKDYYGMTGRNPNVRKELFFPEPGICLVKYEVQERPPARVGQIFIVGNEVTRQDVILNQVPLYPGQVLTFPDLRVAERNLARLNIFEANPETGVRPTVQVLDPESDSEFKDLLVTVQETRTGALLLGVGVNSDAGLTGNIVLNERNFDITRFPTSWEDLFSGKAFRGGGQEMRIEAMPGTVFQRYSATFREPFLFNSPYNLTAGGYYFTRNYDEYNEERLGMRLGLGRRFNQYWSASGGVRVENVGVHDVPSFAPVDYTSVVGDNFLAGFRASVSRDSRDSFLRPTEGNLVEVSFEQATGEFTFPLFTLESNSYFTLYQRPDGSGRHVLAMRNQIGVAGSNTPVYERFFAGGFRSLRGFQFRGVGPFVNGFNVGGDFMLLNSLEYQVPLRANDQIFLVGFVDTGTVESDVEITNYRVAAGFGFRFVVPMLGPVPIALDFGFPVVKGPGDQTQIFSFWLGFFN